MAPSRPRKETPSNDPFLSLGIDARPFLASLPVSDPNIPPPQLIVIAEQLGKILPTWASRVACFKHGFDRLSRGLEFVSPSSSSSSSSSSSPPPWENNDLYADVVSRGVPVNLALVSGEAYITSRDVDNIRVFGNAAGSTRQLHLEATQHLFEILGINISLIVDRMASLRYREYTDDFLRVFIGDFKVSSLVSSVFMMPWLDWSHHCDSDLVFYRDAVNSLLKTPLVPYESKPTTPWTALDKFIRGEFQQPINLLFAMSSYVEAWCPHNFAATTWLHATHLPDVIGLLTPSSQLRALAFFIWISQDSNAHLLVPSYARAPVHTLMQDFALVRKMNKCGFPTNYIDQLDTDSEIDADASFASRTPPPHLARITLDEIDDALFEEAEIPRPSLWNMNEFFL